MMYIQIILEMTYLLRARRGGFRRVESSHGNHIELALRAMGDVRKSQELHGENPQGGTRNIYRGNPSSEEEFW